MTGQPDDTTSDKDDQSIAEEIQGMLENGECTVVEVDGKRVTKLRVTKIGQRRGKSDRIEELSPELVKERILNTIKRIYRREDDLPKPELGAQAEANRTTAKLTPRISPNHVDLFNEVAAQFPSKRDALEKAVELLAERSGIEIDFDS